MKRFCTLPLLSFLMAIVAVILAGCGGGGGTPAPTKADVTVVVTLPSAGTRGITDVTKLQVIARIGETTTYDGKFNYAGQGTATLTCQIPVGDNVIFTVNALRSDGKVEFTGKSGSVSVRQNPPTTVNITLQPPTAGVDVGVTIHEIDGPPKIELTSIPPYGSYENLKGRVKNLLPQDGKIIVFIQAWVGWWVKPYANSPITQIQADGTFETDITTGGIDNTAAEIKVWLVTPDYVYDGNMPPDPANDPTHKVLDMVHITRTPT